MGMARSVPKVPGAMGEYPTPKPVASKKIKRLIFD